MMSVDPFENYPLNPTDLERWIDENSEGELIEFNQQISISEPEEKAEFIKDIMSLANSAWSNKKISYLIVGVTKSGGLIDSTSIMADDATYQQIEESYITPKIIFALRRMIIKNIPIYIFVILPSPSFHKSKRAIQDSDNTLFLPKYACWFRTGSSKDQIEPQKMIQLKYGGKLIRTCSELAEWLKIDHHKVKTIISEEKQTKIILSNCFPLKSPFIIIGQMGTGKTTMLYQIGLKFLERNYFIIVNIENYYEDLVQVLQ